MNARYNGLLSILKSWLESRLSRELASHWNTFLTCWPMGLRQRRFWLNIKDLRSKTFRRVSYLPRSRWETQPSCHFQRRLPSCAFSWTSVPDLLLPCGCEVRGTKSFPCLIKLKVLQMTRSFGKRMTLTKTVCWYVIRPVRRGY